MHYSSCCGCGCNHFYYKMEVPADSPMQNGHTLTANERTEIKSQGATKINHIEYQYAF